MMLSDCELEWIWGYKHARGGGGSLGEIYVVCVCVSVARR